MEVIKQKIMKKLFYLIAAMLLPFAGYSQWLLKLIAFG